MHLRCRLPYSLYFLIAWLWVAAAHGQLCSGSLGDPVVSINFGTSTGAPLPNTSYNFIYGSCPNDGSYTVTNYTGGCFGDTWHSFSDHTGNGNGYFMLVNASFQPGDFYKSDVTGLCGNTTYEFSAWVVNVLKPSACDGSGIRPNLTFSIETLDGTKLKDFNTGNIDATAAPQWNQYGMFFTTPAGVSDVRVRITNNAPGGCGNDLALDDIAFRPCGATISVAVDGVVDGVLNVCEGDATAHQFAANVSNGYVQPQYQWQQSGDGGQTWTQIAGAVAPTYTWAGDAVGTHLYRVLVAEQGSINSPSCRIASKPVQVSVYTPPQVTLQPIAPLCEGAPLLIKGEANMFNGGTPAITWQTPGGGYNYSEALVDSIETFAVQREGVTASDSGVYTVQVKNDYGCATEASTTLTLLPKPIADFTQMNLACEAKAASLQTTATMQGGSVTQWGWAWNGGTATGTDAAPMFVDAGTYSVLHWAISDKGCFSDTIAKNIDVQPLPTAAFLTPEICLSDPAAQFRDASFVAGGSITAWQWAFGDPQQPGAGATTQNGMHRYTKTGVYTVKLTVTSNAGCVGDTVQQFTVNGAVPKAALILPNGAQICSADSLVLRNASTVDFGSITRVEIYWKGDTDPAAITIDEEPQPGKEYRFSYAPFITGNGNQFRIRYVVYSGISCVNEVFQEVSIRPSPALVFDAITPVCANVPAFGITAVRETTGLAGSGVYSGRGVSANGVFNPAVAGPGNHTVQYTYTSSEGCIAVAVQNIPVYAVPIVNAGPDQTLLSGGSVTLAASASGNGLQYLWSPATDLSDAQILQPKASPQTETNYKLTVASADGCVAEDETVVKVVPELYVPNAFTPNGDGLNDYWQVPFLQSLEGSVVTIFDRYGGVIFQSKADSFRWDGTVGGKAMPSGVYVYLIKLKEGRTFKGTLALIR